MAGAGRETFYEAQRRNRRASWRFAVLSGVAVVVLGLPLSVLVSPAASAFVILASDVVNLVTPTPDAGGALEDFIERWLDAEDARDRGEPADLPVAQAVTVGVAMLMPGVLVMLLAWLLVRRIFMRSATGAVVLAAGARPPNPADVEERRLVNLVEEMALAAGVHPPRVMVIDADILNAAVVGRSIDDVTIVVPRRLLAELGRDPTSAVIADLLATVVNGDLRASLVIASVFQTFDLVGAVVAAPLDKRTRQVLGRLVRLALRRSSSMAASAGQDRAEPPGAAGAKSAKSTYAHDAEVHYIAEELGHLAALGGLDDDPNAGEGCAGCLTFPFLIGSSAYALTHGFVGSFLMTPLMAALWRRRRLLADATAVELTRNPDALVRAFEHISSRPPGVVEGPWVHLFLVAPELRSGKSSSLVWSDLDRFLPRMDKRLGRLEAMGAQLSPRPEALVPVPAKAPRPTTVGGWLLAGLQLTVATVLGLALLALFVVCVLGILLLLAFFIYITILIELVLVVVPVLLLNRGLR